MRGAFVVSHESKQSGHAREAIMKVPTWVEGAGRWRAFRYGFLRAMLVPGWILLISACGFGVLAQDAGLSLFQSLLVMAVFFGLPAQVAVADQLARDATFFAAAIAVALTGIRLLPMTVTLMPYLGGKDKGPTEQENPPILAKYQERVGQLIAVHFIAVTAWFEGMRALPSLPERLRLIHFIGIGIGLVSMTLAGTAIGYLLVEVVPPVVAAVLLFVSPMYFLLSLIDTGRLPVDIFAIVLGCALSPVFYLLVPEFDLLITGLFGGTLAYLFGRKFRGLSVVSKNSQKGVLRPPSSGEKGP